MDLTVKLEHAWVVLETYSLTQEQAERSMKGDSPVTLTDEMSLGLVGPVCHSCGEHFLTAAGSGCPGAMAE